MSTSLIIIIMITILLYGLILELNKLKKTYHKIDFAGEYRNKYITLVDNYYDQDDNSLISETTLISNHYWLTLNVYKIQQHLGRFGLKNYQPPFHQIMHINYPIIENTIPKFRNGSKLNSLELCAVEDSLNNYIGFMQEISKETKQHLKNPLIWFREGLKSIISIPLMLLYWFGILNEQSTNSITNNVIYKTFSGVTALCTFLGTIVTIAVGYDETLEFVIRMF
jgi:hypothetical protein